MKRLFYSLIVVLVFFASVPSALLAQSQPLDTTDQDRAIEVLDPDLPRVQADDKQIENVLSAVFLIIGGVAVLFMVIGGVRYTVSGGDSAKTQQAKNTVLYALIGTIVSLFAFAIVRFVIAWL